MRMVPSRVSRHGKCSARREVPVSTNFRRQSPQEASGCRVNDSKAAADDRPERRRAGLPGPAIGAIWGSDDGFGALSATMLGLFDVDSPGTACDHPSQQSPGPYAVSDLATPALQRTPAHEGP